VALNTINQPIFVVEMVLIKISDKIQR
jgi:hypothetical protein